MRKELRGLYKSCILAHNILDTTWLCYATQTQKPPRYFYKNYHLLHPIKFTLFTKMITTVIRKNMPTHSLRFQTLFEQARMCASSITITLREYTKTHIVRATGLTICSLKPCWRSIQDRFLPCFRIKVTDAAQKRFPIPPTTPALQIDMHWAEQMHDVYNLCDMCMLRLAEGRPFFLFFKPIVPPPLWYKCGQKLRC